ncbi:hypothetical protein KDL45_11705 [bacterium]|nr:hypothetical protein [bacterium]
MRLSLARRWRLGIAVLVVLLSSGCAAQHPEPAPGAYSLDESSTSLPAKPDKAPTLADDQFTYSNVQVAGAARLEITPRAPVIMGGYGVCFLDYNSCRWSVGVHDPLYATALYLGTGPERLLLIHADLVGLTSSDINLIRKAVAERVPVPYQNIVIASSHTHHGPDTIGLWGSIIPPTTGRNGEYIPFMRARMAAAGVQAFNARLPARLSYTVATQSELHRNEKEDVDPDAVVDDTLTLLKIEDKNGQVIATLTNWGCHPTTGRQRNHRISADWVGGFYKAMRRRAPGLAMFVNGAIGASIQPNHKWEGHPGYDAGPLAFADAMGAALADQVIGLMDHTTPISPDATLRVHSGHATATMTNSLYRFGSHVGILDLPVPKVGDSFTAPFTAATLGPIRLGTVPGEITPVFGNQIRDILGGDAQIIVGLAQEYTGYIITPEQYDDPRYSYEKMLCISPTFGEAIVDGYSKINFY